MRLIDEIKPTLDTLDTNFYAIEPTVDARHPLFDRRQPNLHVEHFVNDAIKLRIEAAQILKDNVIRFIRHRCLLLRRDHVGGVENADVIDIGFA